jgi:TRAP-type C4-dicarboxylate transport system permease large subunit
LVSRVRADPFVVIMLATVALLIAAPGLALWLPERMFGQ